MGIHYEQLTPEERATIMLMQQDGCIVRAMARTMHRAPSTISRELRRFAAVPDGPCSSETPCAYDARLAGLRARRLRYTPRRESKRSTHKVLFGVVLHFLAEGWSPAQIAGTLKRMWPDNPERTVSHETIYNCIYAQPRGELRRELIACLRKAHSSRVSRPRGTDRRGQLPEMLSIHL